MMRSIDTTAAIAAPALSTIAAMTPPDKDVLSDVGVGGKGSGSFSGLVNDTVAPCAADASTSTDSVEFVSSFKNLWKLNAVCPANVWVLPVWDRVSSLALRSSRDDSPFGSSLSAIYSIFSPLSANCLRRWKFPDPSIRMTRLFSIDRAAAIELINPALR
jgi:hypothetical protein